MIKRLIIFMQIFFILPISAAAFDNHWAENELQTINHIYGIYIDDPESYASIDLQENIFRIVCLNIVPEEGLKRYWIIKYMVDNLGIAELPEEEVAVILSDCVDLCDHCGKANMVLARAKKCGLLEGRWAKEGLVNAPKEPVTNAELTVFALRYIKIRDAIKN